MSQADHPIVITAAQALALCRLGTQLAPLADLPPDDMQAPLLRLLADRQNGDDLLVLMRVCFGPRVDSDALPDLLTLMLAEGPAKVTALLSHVERDITPRLAAAVQSFGTAK